MVLKAEVSQATVTLSAVDYNNLIANSKTGMLFAIGDEAAKIAVGEDESGEHNARYKKRKPLKFSPKTTCIHCECEDARLILVGKERLRLPGEELKYICQLIHEDKKKKSADDDQEFHSYFDLEEKGIFWAHGMIAVAVYLCTNCVKLTALGAGEFPTEQDIQRTKKNNEETRKRREEFQKKNTRKKK